MVEISQQEFENCIKDLINKKTTKVELAKKLKTDIRKLANKIYEIDNKELLNQYIKMYPYKPAKNENIDYEALIIEIVKTNESVMNMQEKYDIAERTYRRNINKIQYKNRVLYTIYKNYISGKMTEEDKRYIDTLERRKVSYSNCVEDRKAQLMQLFLIYEKLIEKGLTEKQAMTELGENTKSLKRKSDELKKILECEKMNKTSEAKSYRESLKTDVPKLEHQTKNNECNQELTEELDEYSKGDEK